MKRAAVAIAAVLLVGAASAQTITTTRIVEQTGFGGRLEVYLEQGGEYSHLIVTLHRQPHHKTSNPLNRATAWTCGSATATLREYGDIPTAAQIARGLREAAKIMAATDRLLGETARKTATTTVSRFPNQDTVGVFTFTTSAPLAHGVHLVVIENKGSCKGGVAFQPEVARQLAKAFDKAAALARSKP
jgi:hypothetical protein